METTCRTCMVYISDPELATSLEAHLDDFLVGSVITELTAVDLEAQDDLPGQICAACLKELKRFIDFIRRVRETDRELRQHAQEIEVKVKTDEEEELYQDVEILQMENESIEDKFLDVEEVFMEVPSKVSLEVSLIDEASEVKYNESDEYGSTDLFQKEESDDVDTMDSSSENQTEESETAPQQTEAQQLTDTDDKIDKAATLKANNIPEKVEQEMFRVIVRAKRDFLCCACFDIFTTKAALTAHSEKHKTKINLSKSHACNICYRRYATARGVKEHRKRARASKIFECVRCRARFIDAKLRKRHTHNLPDSELLKSSVLTPIRFKPHYRRGHICCAQACGLSFSSDEALIAHAHEAHRLNKYEASLPDKREKPYQCKVCFKRFDSREGIRYHHKRKYRQTKLQCSFCGLNLPSNSALITHERQHKKEKPFSCEECSKCFSNAGTLRTHMLVHSDDYPFVCSVCGKGFQRKAAHKNHELIHSGALPFPCELCSKSFRVKAVLQQHMRIHTGDRPYPCRYCEKAFADHSNRLRHEMGHTGIKPYKCSYCEKTFITRRLQKEHERTHNKSRSN